MVNRKNIMWENLESRVSVAPLIPNITAVCPEIDLRRRCSKVKGEGWYQPKETGPLRTPDHV